MNSILVTGSHRSGTTWIGRNLALAPRTGYVHEPFNIGIKYATIEKPFENWYQYISEENAMLYRVMLDKVFDCDYPLFENLNKVKSARNLAHIFKQQALMYWNKARGSTLIVKDPIAFFSSEWLCKTYNMNALVSIRHPAAFCSSLKVKNWQFDFNSFLNQPLLMQRYLAKFQDEILEFTLGDKCIIEQAILLWNCIHHTVLIYQKAHPNWLFVRHEDLSIEPVKYFESIYSKFGLEFTQRVKLGILESSGPHNPSEQLPNYEFKRDSKANIKNFKNRLSSNEIDLIKHKTNSISSFFYHDSEW